MKTKSESNDIAEVSKKVEHYPTPWFIDEDENGDRIIVDSLEGGLIIARQPNEANAAFIVRAVNSHEELLEAMKNCLEYDNKEIIKDTLREAISRAEGDL